MKQETKHKFAERMKKKRFKHYDNGVKGKGIEFRHIQCYHSILIKLVTLDRKLTKDNLILLYDKRIETDKPVIFSCTHSGGTDIQRAFEILKSPAYLFLGDPENIYLSFPGLLMYLNGVICIETRDKKDRKIGSYRANEVLSRKGNLLIFPEGAWNITHNLPVTKLYKGTADLGITNNADIIPVGIEQYENDFYIAIGENIACSDFDNSIILTNYLRDKMSELKWDIWEIRGIQKRSEITKQHAQVFAQSIIDRDELDSGTVQDVLETKFHDKSITEYDEAFAHLNDLIPNINNVFLFSRRYYG